MKGISEFRKSEICSATCSVDVFFPWRAHSQITITRQDFSSKASTLRLSRLTVCLNLESQKSRRDAGVAVNRQPSCRCQKQPWMKIATRYFGKTISGFPGRSFLCNLYLYPFAHSHLRTIISGRVSFPRILDMLKLRCSGEWTSIIESLPAVLRED